MKGAALRPLVGDLRQVASVRRIVLDDGPERGVRALAFSTGGGLDFWVLADRSLDIGTVAWGGAPLAWQSPAGFRSPALNDAEGDGGHGLTRSFSGFLVTCGLDHIRQPAQGQPLHGRLPFSPARVTAYGEDWESDPPRLYCEGEVVQARLGGEAFRLRRRIEAAIGGSGIRIRDTVENIGPDERPQALLYHFNLGYPAIAAGTTVAQDGEPLFGPIAFPDPDCVNAVACRPARGDRATCTVTTPTGNGRFIAAFAFDARTLPWLQTWRNFRPGVAVLGIEPCTSDWLPRGLSGPERPLAPGERRAYAVDVAFSGPPPRPADGAREG